MSKLINDNGIVREMTPEEEADLEYDILNMPKPEPTPEERIRDLEEALDLLLSGVTE